MSCEDYSGDDPTFDNRGESDSDSDEWTAGEENDDSDSDGDAANPADGKARYISCGEVNSARLGRTMQEEYGGERTGSTAPEEECEQAWDDNGGENTEPVAPKARKRPRISVETVFPASCIPEGGASIQGGEDYPSPQPPAPRLQHVAERPRTGEKCWLCTFCLHPKAKQITSFICANISNLDHVHIAQQIKMDVLDTFPHAKGIRKRDILRHIREHMLAPNVKIASVLRSLITLAETLRGTLHQRDPETGDIIIDLKSTDLYLKVLTQIRNVYTMDNNKLLYGSQSGNG